MGRKINRDHSSKFLLSFSIMNSRCEPEVDALLSTSRVDDSLAENSLLNVLSEDEISLRHGDFCRYKNNAIFQKYKKKSFSKVMVNGFYPIRTL